MANTLPDTVLPAGTWVNLYAATGILVGSALDIWNKGAYPAEVAISLTQPANGIGVPIYAGPLSSYLGVSAGESGAWAYSAQGTKLSVQEG